MIAYDTTTNAGRNATTAGSTLTWSHTCTGSNLILIVGVSWYHATRTVSGVTYAGVAMTQVGATVNNGSFHSAVFYLNAPSTGANNVVVTWSGGVDARCGAISYTGAKQSGQPDASNTATGNTTPCSVTVTTVADNCWVISNIAINPVSITLSCSNTQRWNGLNTGSPAIVRGGGSDTNGPKTPAGNQTMTWTYTPSFSNAWALIGISIAPAPTTLIKKVSGVAQASIKKIAGVAITSVKKVSGVSNVG